MVGKIVITATHLPGEPKKPERRERSRADHVGQAWGRLARARKMVRAI